MRVFLGLEPGTGKKLYATKTVRGGKREAQQALAEMVTHAAEGRLSVARASIGELLEEWFAHTSPRLLAIDRPWNAAHPRPTSHPDLRPYAAAAAASQGPRRLLRQAPRRQGHGGPSPQGIDDQAHPQVLTSARSPAVSATATRRRR
ncbi:MAG: hypothetical protein ABIV94_08590 [Acidimicrobiales bacterium]